MRYNSTHTHVLLLTLFVTATAIIGCKRKRRITPPPPAASSGVPLTTTLKYKGDGPLKLGPIEELSSSPGMTITRHAWKFNDTEGYAWRVRVPNSQADLSVRALDDLSMLQDFLPKDQGPWAAINGGFYESSPSGGFSPMGVVIANGERVHDYKTRGGSGVLAVDKMGRASILHRSKWKLRNKEPWKHALQSIDRIVAEGEVLVNQRPDTRVATRGAVVLGKDYTWLVTTAARGSMFPTGDTITLKKTSYVGMPLWAFAQYIERTTDVVDALNMDGAVSTHMVVKTPKHSLKLKGPRGVFNAVVLRAAPPK